MTETLTVAVHGIAVGGAGVGRVVGPDGDPRVGMAVFVPFVAPGETATVRVVQAHARHLDAELIALETRSPERVAPPCPHFGSCGGCDLQHLSLTAQHRAKEELVRGALRAGGLGALTDLLAPIVAGPALGYRRRLTLHADGSGAVGLYRRGTRTLLPLTQCPVAESALDTLLQAGLTLPDGLVGALSLEADGERVDAAFRASSLTPADVHRLQPALAAFAAGGTITAGGKTLATFGTTGAQATLGAFSQVNAAINAALVERVCAAVSASGARTAYDLYAGAGNFALPLAERGLSVTAVEAEPRLVAAGRQSCEERGLTMRLAFQQKTVERWLRSKPSPVDALIADPPRAGLGPLTEQLPPARFLALVSCHLPSAVRDIKALQARGWTTTALIPFDMFAQTTHVELLTLLRY